MNNHIKRRLEKEAYAVVGRIIAGITTGVTVYILIQIFG